MKSRRLVLRLTSSLVALVKEILIGKCAASGDLPADFPTSGTFALDFQGAST